MSEVINAFQGEYRFLSNFWPARVSYQGFSFPTVENGYMAAKSMSPTVWRLLSQIEGPTPMAGPRLAKKIGSNLILRADWSDIKLQVMRDLVWQKFDHPHLAELLKQTNGRELIEGNTWGDVFWGVCDGVGENHLGRLLMEKREHILSVAK